MIKIPGEPTIWVESFQSRRTERQWGVVYPKSIHDYISTDYTINGEAMSKNPFQPVTIGGIQLKNRFVRSATFESVAEKGKVSQPYLQMHEALAKGGVGLIITGYLSFSKMDHILIS